jgi:hypothetical protein
MATAKKYSQLYYWRYVFTPIFILLLGAGLYLLFTLPDSHSLDYSQVVSYGKKVCDIDATKLSLSP